MMYPKIGIRPVIDGRWGGIREGLEAQTMGMAHAAKALIETLKYPDGTPVQVVVIALHHRRRRRSGPLRGIFLHPECDRHPDRDPLLVLRHGDLRHGPASPSRPSGASTAPSAPARYIWRQCWPPMPRSGLPAFSIYGHDVQDMGDYLHSRRRGRKDSAVCPLRRRRRLDEEQILCQHRRGRHGH